MVVSVDPKIFYGTPNFAKTLFGLGRFLNGRFPGAWWLILCAIDVPYTDVYNTRPRQKFTVYTYRGPVFPQFLYTRPQMPKIKVSFTD